MKLTPRTYVNIYTCYSFNNQNFTFFFNQDYLYDFHIIPIILGFFLEGGVLPGMFNFYSVSYRCEFKK